MGKDLCLLVIGVWGAWVNLEDRDNFRIQCWILTLTNLQRLWILGGGQIVVLPCLMTRDVRKPVTFSIVKRNWYTMLREVDQVSGARLHCYGTEREWGLGQCLAASVSWNTTGL